MHNYVVQIIDNDEVEIQVILKNTDEMLELFKVLDSNPYIRIEQIIRTDVYLTLAEYKQEMNLSDGN